METRSRKRVEATTHRPSTSTPARASKRTRHSASSVAGASGVGASSASGAGTPPIPPRRTRLSTRTSTAAAGAASTGQSLGKGMETGAEAVPSASRRDREKSSRRRESDGAFAHPLHKDEEERGIAEKLEREMEKGKETEKENDRVRERSERAEKIERVERAERVERDKAASTAASSGDDDNDGGGGSNFNQNLASASSALHGLLRKLGAGLDDLMPLTASSSHQSSKLKRILSGLRSEGEDERQLEALSQLCELLSIGTEESLSSFSVDSFVPVLVGLLNYEYSPDIMLLAARAVTHLCDVLPSSCAAVVHYGAVPCFCARLLTIEYIDLAEQSLQALEKISHEHPTACLRAGALMAVLSFLDFFSTGVQRVAVTTAANMCRQLPSDAVDFVTEAVPLLTNLLQYQDSKVVEHASVCLSRIAESFGSSSEKLDMLCAHGLIPLVARLISVSNSSVSLIPQASLSSSTYTGLIRLLSTCASGSAGAAESLLMLRISSILKDVLAGSGLISSTSGSGSSANRPPEQLYEIVTLVNELLPALPDGLGVGVGSSSSGASGSRGGRKHTGVAIATKTEESVGAEPSAREILLRKQPELLEQFSNDLFPVLVQVYGSSVNPPVRHKCLAAISKLVHFSTPEILRSLLLESNISSFVAGVLGSKDVSLLMMALQIAEMLMQKLPDVFIKMYVKEGVVHALDTLIASEGAGAASPPPGSRSGELAANAVVTASGGILPPPRPRRGGANRRKSIGSADEEGGLSTSAPAGTMLSPPSAESLRAIRSGLLASAIVQAKKIRETYFPGDAGSLDEGVTESLRKLKSLCARLKGENGVAAAEGSKGKGKGKARGGGSGSTVSALSEEQLGVVVGELLAELGAGDGVSTFEFVGSGVVGSLIHHFSCGNTSKEKVDDAGLREQAVKRLKQFIEVALPGEEKNGVGSGGEAPLTLLVRKLQNALASLERFPVVLSHAPRSSTGPASFAAGLSALTQPFKLRLCRATGDKMLRDYSTNIVLIEPLATLVAVEDFLWPRVKRQEAAAAGGASTSEASAPIAVPGAERRSTRSRFLVGAAVAGSRRSLEPVGNSGAGASSNTSGTKGKGKAVSRLPGSSPGGEDSLGPETRNAAARRRAAAAAASASAAAAKAASECESEEDVDVLPIELNEALAMDEDDLSEEEDEDEDDDEDHDDVFGDDPVASCKGDRVHDVQLGDAEGGAVASSSDASQPSAGVSVVSRAGVLAPGAAETSKIGILENQGSLSYAAAALANARENGSRFCGRERKSLATAASAANMPPKLVFSLEGKPLNRTLTIFQAIQRQVVAEEDEDEQYAGTEHPSGGGRRLWDEVYTLTYQRAEASGEAGKCGSGKRGSASPSGKGCSSAMVASWQQTSLVDSTLVGELPCDLDRSNKTYEILVLLRVLEGLNKLAPRLRAQGASEAFARGEVDCLSESPGAGPIVPREEFLSSKLTPKLARQMQDALALCSGGLPSWCGQLTLACPFLFPFETRRQYFHSTAFGLSRALQRLQAQQSSEGTGGVTEYRELRVGRLQRQKVRVTRQRILESAAKVMELYAGHKAVLEVEYFGEVGTGLGPTLEFYTLLSHELQKEELEMWRTEMRSRSEVGVDVEMAEARGPEVGWEFGGESEVASSSGAYVNAPQGLFPRPWHPETDASSNKKYGKVLEHFRLLGRVMAKALQDGRLLDLPLSTPFYKIVLGQELDLYDIETLDPELGRTLVEMQVLVRKKQFVEASGQSVDGLRFRGSRVEDLCLDFTLPGHPDYELKSQGRDVMVELENLEEYISLVVEATVKGGIGAQVEAFRAGFNQVFQLSSLQIFSQDELEYLLCGRRELWAPESLPDIMKFDHGYTASSPPIRNLLGIMSELTPDEQRAFLRFVTGAPRLPPGGLAALSPKLTIVRKHPTGGTGTAFGTTPPGALAGMGTTLADRDLPSVMTCANYLKLPPYSCKEIMKERLMYAIYEGQGSFDLS
ncbi:hypothetical protein KC19_VG127600 [Ceratodon purpureus]|uniref:HECT-type E3 ubiquitin transferase n=2 Tax=Embryophyta TaxID=3193 RepID=A0A8T0HPL0_CERPU|nr:hypothetical protein KC19_VG127600 [Ceratodon purpureus]